MNKIIQIVDIKVNHISLLCMLIINVTINNHIDNNKCNSFPGFLPPAMKMLGSISSVVHLHASGHVIAYQFTPRYTFIRDPYL